MYLLGVITEGVRDSGSQGSTDPLVFPSHACFCGKNCICYVPSEPKDDYKISCGLLEVKESLLVTFSDGLRPNITFSLDT